MKAQTKLQLLSEIIAGLFIILFVYAACNKLMDYQKFLIELGKSPVLAPFARPVSLFVPAIELAIAAALISRRWQLTALYAGFTMMVIFSTYILTILNFSEYIPCSCGGILETMSWQQHFWFNIVFVLLGIAGVLAYPKKSKNLLAIRGERRKT